MPQGCFQGDALEGLPIKCRLPIRDALHFAVLYSRHPEWSNDGRFVTPKDGYWMDPNAFHRQEAPYDSRSLAALPNDQKRVPVAFMKLDGSFVNPDIKRIWPYACR